jgi:UDP-N-acetyl-D-glucosamine dehydrogenase
MPEYVVERVEEILKTKKITLKKAKILVVGVTYKKDIKDLRKSPPLDIIYTLQKRNVSVSYFDPIIPYLKLDRINMKSIEFKKDTIDEFDCVVIATDHSNVDYDFLLRNARLIFDTRNVYKNISDKKVILL